MLYQQYFMDVIVTVDSWDECGFSCIQTYHAYDASLSNTHGSFILNW